MKKCILGIFVLTTILSAAKSQDAVEQLGEFGITVGAAHYFGDLNTRAQINRPKPAIGIFFKKQFNNYLGIRASMHYAQLGYSDIYSKVDYQKRRNLSFNTDIVELALQGDFNFFKFVPGDVNYSFTPFVSIGMGVFSYNPYALYQNKKYYLRPLGTEGQNIGYIDPNTGKKRKPYGSMAVCFPIGAGIKYNLSSNINLSFQITHRLTLTDYIDDVSTTFIGIDKFPVINGQPSIAGILQDRSFETGSSIGVEGRQRGFSKQKDQYIIAEIGVSFSITSYKCPSAK
jgi:opacity protein-like surface antigen